MRVELIRVPYDSGHRDRRMGRGPLDLVHAGLPDRLAEAGRRLRIRTVELDLDFPTENAAAFALARGVAAAVEDAREEGRFPLVLSGNCNSCLGTVSGLGTGAPGVVWFDAHGDFNTPATSASGFLDGMALATLAGRCWQAAASAIPGFAPVPEGSVVLVGARDLEPAEERALEASEVTLLSPADGGEGGLVAELGAALDRLGARSDGVYVHVDLDVLDPGEGRANRFAAPGGLALDDLLGCIAEIGDRCPVRGGALTAYDPEADEDGRAREAALAVSVGLVESAASR